jgi:TonB family protein
MGKKGILDFEADLSLVVDITGRPQDVCLTQSAGWGLDAKAAEAVQKYQFNPAIKDGKPVAARIVVQVKFQLSVSKF